VDTLYDRLERAFGGPVDQSGGARFLAPGHEVDRTLAVWDGAEMIGTGGAFTFRLTVPAAPGGAPGVTMVSVQATHRRPRGADRHDAAARLTTSTPAVRRSPY